MTPWLLIIATAIAWTAAGILAWRTYPKRRRGVMTISLHPKAWEAMGYRVPPGCRTPFLLPRKRRYR